MFLGFKIWNGKPPITQWYSFTFKKNKIASKSGAKCFVNLHLVLTCMKLLLYLLIKNIVQIGIIVFKASQHIYFLCSAGKENDCLQQAVFFCCVHNSCSLRQECVNALQATWHPECFLCTHCKQPIGGNQFHIEEGKPYCEKGGHFSASFYYIFCWQPGVTVFLFCILKVYVNCGY